MRSTLPIPFAITSFERCRHAFTSAHARENYGLASPVVRDRRPAVAPERLRPQPHSRGRLPALVLGAVDHRDGALHDVGIEPVAGQLLPRAVELDVRLEDAIELRVGG